MSIKQLSIPEVVEYQKDAISEGRWICCENCMNFTEDKICKLAGETPPIKVLIVGCELWEDLIPF